MKKAIVVLVLGVVFLFAPGCAAIATGTSQEVSFNSSPQGAKVTIHPKGTTGITPFSANLQKGRSYTCVAEKDGRKPDTQKIGKSLNGWVFGNILLGGLIGMIIDIGSGAWFNLDTTSVNFHLAPDGK